MLTEIYILFIIDLMIPHNGMNSINVIASNKVQVVLQDAVVLRSVNAISHA